MDQSILELLTHIRETKSDIKIQIGGEIISLLLQDILFIEAMGHTVIYHLSPKKRYENQQYTCYSTLTETEQVLKERGFLRIHKSYLVNMAYIKKISNALVLLQNGVELPVGNKYYAESKKKYLLWKGLK